jgi:hypothetical protein
LEGPILAGGTGLARYPFLAGVSGVFEGQAAVRGELGFQHSLPAARYLAEFLIEESSFRHDPLTVEEFPPAFLSV